MLVLEPSLKCRTLALLSVVAFLVLGPMVPVARAAEADFYVDSFSGSDSNSGTSPDDPWRTLAPVQARNFQPGATIHLCRGSSWDGGLVINDSGVEGNPITFTSYGTGAKPIIRNPEVTYGRAVQIDAQWVVVEGLLVRDAHEAGIRISSGANHNVVRDCEATNVGMGIAVHGQHNLITQNYAHDLTMVKNTSGGNDDYGAVGIWLFNTSNEVSYNRMVNCIAPSHDYGTDGGAVEGWGDIDGSYIHHNWAQDCDIFMEVAGGSARNVALAYNVALNNSRFAVFHMGGKFAGQMESFRIENNTIVEPADEEMNWVVLAFIDGTPASDSVIVRNNIFYIDGFWHIANTDGFTHDHNLYHLASPEVTTLGLALDEGEQVAESRLLDPTEYDFRLQAESPAIDAGAYLGYPLDYDDNAVPLGSAPDLGAFEYGAGATSPTPTATPTAPADPDEVIIDDSDAGFSTTSAQDSWVEYTATGGQHYGDTHHYNRQMGSGLDTATWAFTLPTPGTYQVYAWWWEGSWRPADVPYTIHHAGGPTTVMANQQTAGGQWNLLGTFDFQDQGSVTVSDDASAENTDVVADAIRLTRVGAPPEPTPTPVPTATPAPTQPLVTTLSPNWGPTEGGTAVAIAGSNFQEGATVAFGGVICDDSTVTRTSANEIVCTIPPHLPAIVDVVVTNPNSESAILPRGFTYQGATARLSLPESHGATSSTIRVPVNAADLQGLVAADLRVTFDGDLLSPRAVTVGDLASGWSIAADLSGPGEVQMSLASPGSAAYGSGALAILELEVVGQHGSTTSLHLSSALLNDGAIPAELTDGSFAADLYAVSGRVRYRSGDAGVSEVLLVNESQQLYSGQSDDTGAFTVLGQPTGTWIMSPSKSDGTEAITAYDASLVLQHAEGIIALNDYAIIAADVDCNGTVNSTDALYILQEAVGLVSLPFPGAGAVWSFDPASRSYTDLNADQSGQDFAAVLLGDVSGNWGGESEYGSSTASEGPATLSVVAGEVDASGRVTVALWLDASQAPVYSLEMAMTYSPSQATALSLQPGPLGDGLALGHDLDRPGEVRLALAGDSPVTGRGELVTLSFQMADPDRSTTRLLLTSGELNEGGVPVQLVSGQLGRGWQVHLPMVLRRAAP